MKEIFEQIQNIKSEIDCEKQAIIDLELEIKKRKININDLNNKGKTILKPVKEIFFEFGVSLDRNTSLSLKKQYEIFKERGYTNLSYFSIWYRKNPTKTYPSGFYLINKYKKTVNKDGSLREISYYGDKLSLKANWKEIKWDGKIENLDESNFISQL